MIQVESLVKEFQIEHRRKGLLGTLHDLFDLERDIKVALNEVSFAIEAGEIVGLIGPNGAGKSTSIKILTGVLVPTSGTAAVNGRIPWEERKAHVRHIGVMFGSRGTLWPELPAIEAFELLACMYGVDKLEYRENIDLLSDMLEIGSFLDRPVRELSLGQRMRCELASVLIHLPEVVFLDEPTIGMDVQVKRRIRELISFYNRERGMTFVYTSHSMHEVEEICPRLIILSKGQVAYDGKTENLRNMVTSGRRIKLRVKDDSQLMPLAGFIEEVRDAIGPYELERADGEYLVIKFDGSQFNVPVFLGRIAEKNAMIRDIVIEDGDIEDIIAKVYEDGLLSGEGA